MRTIYGMMMRPSSDSEGGYKKIYQSSEFYTEKDFLEEYRKHIIAMQHISECAKIFILENWEKVKDWTDLEVVIRDNKSKTLYYNHIPSQKDLSSLPPVRQNLFEKHEEAEAKNHNPVVSFDSVVLDTSDGDFSVTINGKQHLWINDEAIIVIANFIENKLKNDVR